MSNYSKTTDFAAKDSLPSGDSGKIIRGSEFETEFDNISTAIATKADAADPTFTGTVTIDGLTVNGNTVLGNAATDTVTVTADIASNLIPSADDTYNLGASGAEWNDLFIDGTANIDTLNLNGTDITATAAELNIMDGVTATTAELNIMDGVTATTTELNYVDGVTSAIQTQLNSKANLSGANFTGSIDVTGTVTADGLTVQDAVAGGSVIGLIKNSDNTVDSKAVLELQTNNGTWDLSANRSGYLDIINPQNKLSARFSSGSPGDFYLYEDTGTTAKFVWDASAEALGIGTTSPIRTFHVNSGATDAVARFESSDATSVIEFIDSNTTANPNLGAEGNELKFVTNSLERMRVDVSGNVGIGTDSPTTNLDIAAASSTTLTVRNTSTVSSILLANGSSANQIFSRGANSSTGRDLAFVQGTSEKMRISGNGNVGIGTTDPDSFVDNGIAVQKQVDEDVISTLFLGPSSSDRGFRFAHGEFSGVRSFYHIFNGIPSSTEGTYTQGAYGGTSVIKFDNSGHMDFYTIGQAVGGSSTSVTPNHAMRISSNGQVLVGKTSSTSATVGCELRQDGHVVGTRSSATALTLNRTTSDGTVAEFRKDGATIGTISAASTNIIYGNDTRGIKIEDALIIPRDVDDTTADNQMDLGSSTSRWKDLYLSGGAYLGGTAAINKLDDFEEGTWTPVASNYDGTMTVNEATYTKIGDSVVSRASVSFDATTDASGVSFTGLPFNHTGENKGNGGFVTRSSVTSAVRTRALGVGTISLRDTSDTGVSYTTLASTTLEFQFIYRTTA